MQPSGTLAAGTFMFAATDFGGVRGAQLITSRLIMRSNVRSQKKVICCKHWVVIISPFPLAHCRSKAYKQNNRIFAPLSCVMWHCFAVSRELRQAPTSHGPQHNHSINMYVSQSDYSCCACFHN